MPPGRLVNLRKMEFSDRRYLYNRGKSTGKIFKALQNQRLIICLMELDSGRRLLAEQGENLRSDSIAVTRLFPKGLLRNLEGVDHQHYRKALVKALERSQYPLDEECAPIIGHWLQKHAASFRETASTPEELTTTLSKISTALLVQMYFGGRLGTQELDRLMTLFHRLGPNGLVWSIDKNQQKAFEDIRDFLIEQLGHSTPGEDLSAGSCVVKNMFDVGTLDDVAIGNLIYMVEMGRYDLHSLFRWLLKYASENSGIMQQIAREDFSVTKQNKSLALAFVQETLRMDQSERLIRVVEKDFVFDEYFFPRHAYVRICLWEAHKSGEYFPDAFTFNPQHFVDTDHGITRFAPFGLDHHRCPMANPVVQMGVHFVRSLSQHFRVEPTTQTKANRGPFHWQPGAHFSVGLFERESSA